MISRFHSFNLAQYLFSLFANETNERHMALDNLHETETFMTAKYSSGWAYSANFDEYFMLMSFYD